ncbi:hypothetical protein [Treponema sp.]|uniref:hypothetical protein n=1 Tax=Treponema sp. TaxID=166 RepID=UPI00388D3945
MEKITKKQAVFIIILASLFIMLIPLGVYLENKFDAVNTQLLLMQAEGAADYSDMMGLKALLKTVINLICIIKFAIGILIILLGIKIVKINIPKNGNK